MRSSAGDAARDEEAEFVVVVVGKVGRMLSRAFPAGVSLLSC